MYKQCCNASIITCPVCLSLTWLRRCWAAVPDAPLSSGDAVSHLRSGSAHFQGAQHKHSSIPQRPAYRNEPCGNQTPRSWSFHGDTHCTTRSFSVCAATIWNPIIWNSLPFHIRLCKRVPASKCHLKPTFTILHS